MTQPAVRTAHAKAAATELPVYLSLGAGLQSSTMALLAEAGEIPRPKAAIFADTQWEPPGVYATVATVAELVSFPVHTVTAGSLYARQLDDFPNAPFFYRAEDCAEGMGWRQCTSKFKIEPIQRKIRELEGVPARARMHPVSQQLGITTDELQRMKQGSTPWQRNVFPLIDLRLTRADMPAIWGRLSGGLPLPSKSSCIGCPYHSPGHWARLDDDTLHLAAEQEAAIQAAARRRGDRVPYFHRRRIPLRDAVAESRAQTSLDFAAAGEDCHGYCDV